MEYLRYCGIGIIIVSILMVFATLISSGYEALLLTSLPAIHANSELSFADKIDGTVNSVLLTPGREDGYLLIELNSGRYCSCMLKLSDSHIKVDDKEVTFNEMLIWLSEHRQPNFIGYPIAERYGACLTVEFTTNNEPQPTD